MEWNTNMRKIQLEIRLVHSLLCQNCCFLFKGRNALLSTCKNNASLYQSVTQHSNNGWDGKYSNNHVLTLFVCLLVHKINPDNDAENADSNDNTHTSLRLYWKTEILQVWLREQNQRWILVKFQSFYFFSSCKYIEFVPFLPIYLDLFVFFFLFVFFPSNLIERKWHFLNELNKVFGPTRQQFILCGWRKTGKNETEYKTLYQHKIVNFSIFSIYINLQWIWLKFSLLKFRLFVCVSLSYSLTWFLVLFCKKYGGSFSDKLVTSDIRFIAFCGCGITVCSDIAHWSQVSSTLSSGTEFLSSFGVRWYTKYLEEHSFLSEYSPFRR